MSRRGISPHVVRERAARIVQERRREYPSAWAAITSVAGELGVGTEAPRPQPRRAEVDQYQRPGVTTTERDQIRKLERENRELRRADEILKASSASFARHLDPRVPTR